jgi:hypothetical protein
VGFCGISSDRQSRSILWFINRAASIVGHRLPISTSD